MKWQTINKEKYMENVRKQNIKRKDIIKASDEKRRREGKFKKWQQENKDYFNEYNRNRRLNKKHEISKEEWENCKNYFNYRCAYCGLKIEDHYIIFNEKSRLGDFHKEHVVHDGANDLSNCIPSCKSCNVSKRQNDLNEWYNENNENFSSNRLAKILIWINGDYNKYLILRSQETRIQGELK